MIILHFPLNFCKSNQIDHLLVSFFCCIEAGLVDGSLRRVILGSLLLNARGKNGFVAYFPSSSAFLLSNRRL